MASDWMASGFAFAPGKVNQLAADVRRLAQISAASVLPVDAPEHGALAMPGNRVADLFSAGHHEARLPAAEKAARRRCGKLGTSQHFCVVRHRVRASNGGAVCNMSVLEDFMRMRLYRKRASEFEVLAETELLPEVRLRYRIAAHHYRELADRDERSDQARTAERLEPLRAKRQEIDQHSPGYTKTAIK